MFLGLFGLLQPLADGFKLMIKEPILPRFLSVCYRKATQNWV